MVEEPHATAEDLFLPPMESLKTMAGPKIGLAINIQFNGRCGVSDLVLHGCNGPDVLRRRVD